MNLQEFSNRARNNKSKRAYTVVDKWNIRFDLRFSPNSEGANGQYMGNTFYVYCDGDLIGDLYDEKNGTFSMWVDKKAIIVKGLTDVMHLERAYMDGNLTDNPI